MFAILTIFTTWLLDCTCMMNGEYEIKLKGQNGETIKILCLNANLGLFIGHHINNAKFDSKDYLSTEDMLSEAFDKILREEREVNVKTAGNVGNVEADTIAAFDIFFQWVKDNGNVSSEKLDEAGKKELTKKNEAFIRKNVNVFNPLARIVAYFPISGLEDILHYYYKETNKNHT